MSDYERGIEAAEDYVQTAHTGTTARGIIEAFLAVQPEVWWCATHGDVQSGDGKPCYRAMAFPERGQRCTRGHKARIVVTP